ncbi:hypothetical protein ACVBEJ_06570, partial [Porticoccus sp. GXU_MW_L64]
GNESEVPLNVSIIGVHLIIGGHHHYRINTGSVDVLAGRLPENPSIVDMRAAWLGASPLIHLP